MHKTATLLALQSCRSHPSTTLRRQRVIVQVGWAGAFCAGGAGRKAMHSGPRLPLCSPPPCSSQCVCCTAAVLLQNPDALAPGGASEAQQASHNIAGVVQRSLRPAANMKLVEVNGELAGGQLWVAEWVA